MSGFGWRTAGGCSIGRAAIAPGQFLLGDLRHAVRQYVRSPVFTLTATATLALGVGATAVIDAIVYSAVLRPLPRLAGMGGFVVP